MKKVLTLVAFMFMMNGLFAQQYTDIELVRSAFKLEKQAVVADYLKLSNEDAEKFWPIYNKYEIERNVLGDRRIKLITDYVNDKEVESVASADAMVKESADIQKKEASLREKYYGVVKSGVSPEVAAGFYQIEDHISVAVRAELWNQLGK